MGGSGWEVLSVATEKVSEGGEERGGGEVDSRSQARCEREGTGGSRAEQWTRRRPQEPFFCFHSNSERRSKQITDCTRAERQGGARIGILLQATWPVRRATRRGAVATPKSTVHSHRISAAQHGVRRSSAPCVASVRPRTRVHLRMPIHARCQLGAHRVTSVVRRSGLDARSRRHGGPA